MPEPRAPNPPFQALKRSLFLWSLPFTFIYFWLPIVSKDLGANALGIGGLFSVFTLATLVLRPLVGRAVDRFGRKPFLVIALLIYAVSMGFFAASRSIGWLYVARLIQGIGSAFLWAAVYTIVADLTPPGQGGRGLGKVAETTTRGGMIGIFVALALTYSLPGDLGWRIAFAGFALTTIIAAWVAWRQVPGTRAASPANPAGRAFSSQLWVLLGLAFLVGMPEAMLDPIYLIYLQDKFGVGMEALAWAFFPAGLAAAFLSTRLGALSDRYGRVPMLVIGLAGAGILAFLMPVLGSLVGLAVLFTLTTVLWGIVDPARIAMVTELTGDQRHGTAYGLYDFAQNLGFTVGPVLGGLAYDVVGKAVPFYIEGLVLAISTAWVLIFLRRPTRLKPEA